MLQAYVQLCSRARRFAQWWSRENVDDVVAVGIYYWRSRQVYALEFDPAASVWARLARQRASASASSVSAGAEHAQVERVSGRAEEVGIDRQDLLDHPVDDVADLGRRVRLVGEHVVAQQRQGVDGVIEVGRSGQRQDVARDFLGPLLDRIGAPLAPAAPFALARAGKTAA